MYYGQNMLALFTLQNLRHQAGRIAGITINVTIHDIKRIMVSTMLALFALHNLSHPAKLS